MNSRSLDGHCVIALRNQALCYMLLFTQIGGSALEHLRSLLKGCRREIPDKVVFILKPWTRPIAIAPGRRVFLSPEGVPRHVVDRGIERPWPGASKRWAGRRRIFSA